MTIEFTDQEVAQIKDLLPRVQLNGTAAEVTQIVQVIGRLMAKFEPVEVKNDKKKGRV